MRAYLAGSTGDSRKLFAACRKRGVKDPCLITEDELQTECYVCKHNLDILAKNSPHFCRKFLKDLVTTAKCNGDHPRASKIVGIPQKEATWKQWQQVNKSTHKARGGLTGLVKVLIADGGYNEYKTQEGVFPAVSSTLVERFHSAQVAPCHQGTFFEDVGVDCFKGSTMP